MDHNPQHGPSTLETPRRTPQTPVPPPKDSIREVGLVAAILLGLVLAIGGIWMYQEQEEESSTATRAIEHKKIARQAKTVTVPARSSPAPSSGDFDVYFDVGQDSLSAKAKSLLAEQASQIAAHKKAAVLLHGHADPRGSAAANEALGRKRARAVEAELVKLGVPKTAIQVFSQGERNTRCRSKTETCYRKNRRVHVSWDATLELTSASAGAGPSSRPASAEKRASDKSRTGTDRPKEAPVRAAQAAPK